MMYSRNIELFKDLSQNDYDNQHYDFHNDFDCTRILFEDETLILFFKKINEDLMLKLCFNKVDIVKTLFFNAEDVAVLTIDTLYRGRAVVNGELLDLSKDGKGYFYLEFYEGQMMEFWADSIILSKTSVDTSDSNL
ncbi:hypothetical protein [Fulvivirga kasyanovii]|uniref:Uncharacterized protein n=1 Tax=Fulvivirga kasyanovii TaxID=396812 RepID=A0ABW9RL51_9BACT|nr:hypothetical protein [Fulvivirga kasyanovii]MTI23640.1 hypothetical protein [Fulvivirga kasyanovii]